MIADEPIYSITSKITTTLFLFVPPWTPSPLRWARRETETIASIAGSAARAFAQPTLAQLRCWARHDKDRRFDCRPCGTRLCPNLQGLPGGRDARGPRKAALPGGGLPKRLRFAESYPAIPLSHTGIRESYLSPMCTRGC